MVMSEQLREILKVISKLSNYDVNEGVMNTTIYKRLPNFPKKEIDYKLNELASRGHITTTKSQHSDKLCHITREGLYAVDLFSKGSK